MHTERVAPVTNTSLQKPKGNRTMAEEYSPRYRVAPYGYGFEPQMSYRCGGGVEAWFPLNHEGYWLEPKAYEKAEVTQHIEMTQEEAERAIICAKRINGIQLICSIEEREGKDSSRG